MPHPQTSSDVGLKQSFTSAGQNRTLTDVEVAERLAFHVSPCDRGASRESARSSSRWAARFATAPRTWTNTNGRLSSRRKLLPITRRCDRRLRWDAAGTPCPPTHCFAPPPPRGRRELSTGEWTWHSGSAVDGTGRTFRSTACSSVGPCARRIHDSRRRTGKRRHASRRT